MMDVSTRGRYAVRVMVFLAKNSGRPVTKTEISQAECVTPGYLQQIMANLVSAGLVKSFRGKSGGFALSRPPEEITVGSVLLATEGKVTPVPCWDVHYCECDRIDSCPTRPFWLKAADMLDELFEGTTIADLIAEAAARSEAQAAARQQPAAV